MKNTLCTMIAVAAIACFSGVSANCENVGGKHYVFEPAGKQFSECRVGSIYEHAAPFPVTCRVKGASASGSMLLVDHVYPADSKLLQLSIDGGPFVPVVAKTTSVRLLPTTVIKLIDKNQHGQGQADILNQSGEKIELNCTFGAEPAGK